MTIAKDKLQAILEAAERSVELAKQDRDEAKEVYDGLAEVAKNASDADKPAAEKDAAHGLKDLEAREHFLRLAEAEVELAEKALNTGGWKDLWPCLSLVLFGAAVGLLAALSQEVGTASALIAALFGLVGGTLAAMYSPKPADSDSRRWIVSSTGLVSLGVLLGLAGGFWLRHFDQTVLTSAVVRERASLDRELKVKGQKLADFLPGAKSNPGPKPNDSVLPPASSVTLRSDVAELATTALDELDEAVARIDTSAGTMEERKLATSRKQQLQRFRAVIESPDEHSAETWLEAVGSAADICGDLGEDAAKDQLDTLAKQAVEEDDGESG